MGHKRQQSFSCPLTLSKTHTHTRVTKSLHVKHCVAVVSGSGEWVGENDMYNPFSVPLRVPHLSLSCSVLLLNKFQSFYEFFDQSENGTKPFCSTLTRDLSRVQQPSLTLSVLCFSGSERNHHPRPLRPLWPGAGRLKGGVHVYWEEWFCLDWEEDGLSPKRTVVVLLPADVCTFCSGFRHR